MADDLDLYCMKLVSFRPKDIQDMEVLSEAVKHGNNTFDTVIKNFVRLYGDEYLLRNDDRKVNFIKVQLSTEAT
ncbi:MAG: hypothetical protein J6M92_16770 [Oribacterium sp.]|nr:hypothetical protein [Oribacterium sp.]